MMKYFTLDGWISGQDLEAVNMEIIRQTRKEYEDYIVSVAERLPPELVRLHQTVRLHEAGLQSLELDVEQKQVLLTVDTYPIDADNVLRPCIIRLQYEQVSSLHSTSDPQKGLPGPYGYGDIGGDEIELLADVAFEHRFVFSSGIELAVRFGGFSFCDARQ